MHFNFLIFTRLQCFVSFALKRILTQNLLEVEEGFIFQLLLVGQSSTKLHLLLSIGLQKFV